MTRALLLLAAALCAACGPAIRTARRSADEPPSAREVEAAESPPGTGCNATLGAFVPGLGQYCQGRKAEGAALMTVAAAELAVGTAAAIQHDVTYPAAAVPLLALSDLVLYQSFSQALQVQLAKRMNLVPQDTLGELVAAPFNARVLSRPEVWAGIIGTTAAGFAVSWALDGWQWHTKDKPRLFGTTYQPWVGYPLAGAIGVGLFEQVAIAEETVFRGYVQSGLARKYGEDRGWIYGSLIFGLAHAPNALFITDSGDRLRYLALGVPFITLVGSYLGLAYRSSGYSLTTSVAVHFWYDLLISAAGFLSDPQHNELAGRISFPF
jgi:membrane protease YdiL (CAAX protease family)